MPTPTDSMPTTRQILLYFAIWVGISVITGCSSVDSNALCPIGVSIESLSSEVLFRIQNKTDKFIIVTNRSLPFDEGANFSDFFKVTGVGGEAIAGRGLNIFRTGYSSDDFKILAPKQECKILVAIRRNFALPPPQIFKVQYLSGVEFWIGNSEIEAQNEQAGLVSGRKKLKSFCRLETPWIDIE
jgi:hypothetical protein